MWLAYLAGYLEKRGHPVCLIDAPATDLDDKAVEQRVSEFAPGLIVVEAATPSCDTDLGFAAHLRRTLGCRTIVAGTHVSALPDDSLRRYPEIDAAVVGEYEIPVGDYLEALEGRRSPEGIEGIVYRGLRVLPRTRFLEDLDQVPFVSAVYRKFLPVPRYFNPNAHHPMVAIVTGRGCPNACQYCVFPQTLTGHRFRRRSVANVLAEFSEIARTMPEARSVFLEDDTFTADPDWVREFCIGLASLRLPLTFTANARPDTAHGLLPLLKSAGLRALCVGFESGNQGLLDAVGKGTRVADFAPFAAAARAAAVRVHGCFMVGLPGETRATMRETLQLALSLPLDSAQFYPLMVYPGTRAFAAARDRGHLVKSRWRDWLAADGTHTCVVRTDDCSDAALVRFCNLARRRFYLRRRYLGELAWRFVTDGDERRRVARAARTFLGHLWGDQT